MEDSIMKLDPWYKGKAGIYKLSIANHIYIGSSISLFSRLKQHKTDLKCNRHQNQYLQRAVNKYGFDQLKYEVLILFSNVKLKTLYMFEKQYIEHFHADLNLKLDPVTENSCITTSKIVYQYDRLGRLIKKWKSCNEAARYYKVHSSGINVACIRPSRQHLCAGYLWSYDTPYPYKEFVSAIYCFDLTGKNIGTFGSTAEIAEALFAEISKKTVLSQLKKKIDSNIPYKNVYLSSTKDFKINPSYIPRYQENKELEKCLSSDPVVYVFGKKNQLLYSKKLSEFDNQTYIKHKIRKGNNRYRLSVEDRYYIPKRFHVKAIEVGTQKEQIFHSFRHAAEVLFGDERLKNNISKHAIRGTSYKNYYFERVLYKTP